MRLAAACVAFALAALPGAAAGDMISTEGMEPWEHCAECHDLSGITRMARFPHLAGQRQAYIEKQVRDFRGHRRSNSRGQMDAITAEISDEEVAKVAAYFSALPPPAPRPPALAESEIAEARRLHEDGPAGDPLSACASCHRDSGASPAPILEAQHADYLAKQLRDFRDGRRQNDPRGVMQAVAQALGDDEIDRLAAYIAGLPRPGLATASDGKSP